jgi:hypothetical protein
VPLPVLNVVRRLLGFGLRVYPGLFIRRVIRIAIGFDRRLLYGRVIGAFIRMSKRIFRWLRRAVR